MNKPIILYIGGAGRSGSTVMDLILGNTSYCVSIGEAKHFFEYFRDNIILCGCGVTLQNCSFWMDVVRSAGFSSDEITEASKLSKFNRSSRAFSFSTQLKTNHKMNTLSTYFTRLYLAVSDVAGKLILVDNSKSPYHLMLLSQQNQFDLRLFHLVRHPIAVAYSWNQRNKVDPAKKNWNMQQRGLLSSMIRWVVENELVETKKHLVSHYHLLRYEDFVDNPAGRFMEAFSMLGLQHLTPEALRFIDNPTSLLTHSVGGNPIRFSGNKMNIKADTDWQSNLPLWKKRILGRLFFPWLWKYGYSLQY